MSFTELTGVEEHGKDIWTNSFLSVLFGGDCERVGWLLSSGSGWKLLHVEIWEVWYGNLSQVSSVKGSMTAFATSL